MKIETSDGGFKSIRFNDIDGTDCELVESSLADTPAIWLGTRQGWQSCMHLSQEHVRELLPFLKEFAKRGR